MMCYPTNIICDDQVWLVRAFSLIDSQNKASIQVRLMCCNLQNVILVNAKYVCDVQIKPDSVTMSSKCDSAVKNDKTLHLIFFITLPNPRTRAA